MPVGGAQYVTDDVSGKDEEEERFEPANGASANGGPSRGWQIEMTSNSQRLLPICSCS